MKALWQRLRRTVQNHPRVCSALIALACLCVASVADARPGGGHTFSGGHSSGGGFSGGSHSYSGGSSGGGDGGLIFYLLFRLIFSHPAVGIPLTIIIIGAYFWAKTKSGITSSDTWDSGVTRPAPPATDLDAIRRLDPAFSAVLFEDFIYHLYAEAHRARGSDGGLDELAPYLQAGPRSVLASREPTHTAIEGIVIGAMSVVGVQVPPAPRDQDGNANFVRAVVRFEANMSAHPEGGKALTDYVVETWSFKRAATATSRPPETTKALRCPNCAAPFQSSDQHRCDYCGEVVDSGLFDWVVDGIRVQTIEHRPPALTGTVPEVGTDRATVFHPALAERLQSLRSDDPSFADNAFFARLGTIFSEVQRAWNQSELSLARPYVSDGLFHYLRYWIEAYRAADFTTSTPTPASTTRRSPRSLATPTSMPSPCASGPMATTSPSTKTIESSAAAKAMSVATPNTGRSFAAPKPAVRPAPTSNVRNAAPSSPSPWSAPAPTAAPTSPPASSTGFCPRSSRTRSRLLEVEDELRGASASAAGTSPSRRPRSGPTATSARGHDRAVRRRFFDR